MKSGTRWKTREGAQVALEEPVSVLYKQMQEWEPPEALFAHSSAVLSTTVEQARVLDRACFGKPVFAACSPSDSENPSPTCGPKLPDADTEPEEVRLFQLGLEEAFFLIAELKCIRIYRHSTEGHAVMSVEEVWRSMQSSKPQFVHLYIAYAHLRAKHWVVRSGLQYGADFMAYRHHPALVHSDYAVVVMLEGQEQRVNSWTEVQAMSRLCGSVAKTLLLLHVIPKKEAIDLSTPFCQVDFTVEAVEVRRWLPEKNRKAS